jgi:hypothetical protein
MGMLMRLPNLHRQASFTCHRVHPSVQPKPGFGIGNQNQGPFSAQIREQMSGPDLHVFTLKFLALKKPVFPP